MGAWRVSGVSASTLTPKKWRVHDVDVTVTTGAEKKWQVIGLQAIASAPDTIDLPTLTVEPGELVTVALPIPAGQLCTAEGPRLLQARGMGNTRRFVAPAPIASSLYSINWETRTPAGTTTAVQKVIVQSATARVVRDGVEKGVHFADGRSPWGISDRVGYRNVDDMLSRDRFYVAHRGGSVTYPEHSMLAYESSVMHGAGALELSLARTVDGVWFGNHDQTLLRTAGVDVDPSTLTWAQVKAIPIKGTLNGQAFPEQPHERAEDILAAYPGHVFFIDPKYEQQRNRTEFFSLLARFPNAKERFVIKYFYDNTSLALAARSFGYKTWGYYYAGDVGNVAATAGNWDILGMEHVATQAVWDQMIATGKPVMGHITPSSAAADAAFSKGAKGVMTSNVTNVIPAITGTTV